MSELTADKTFYVRLDGLDTNNGLTSGNAFLTPQRAADETKKWRTGEFTLTVDIGIGSFEIATALDVDHCDGKNVVWTGVATEHADIACYDFQEVTVNVDFGMTYITACMHVPATPNLEGTGDWANVLIRGASGGTNPHLLNGCHHIDAFYYNHETKVIQVYLRFHTGAEAVPSGNITAAEVTLLQTKLYHSGTVAGLQSSSGRHCGNWDNMVFSGSSLERPGICMSNRSAIVLGPNFVAHRALPALLCQSNAVINADGAFVQGGHHGSVQPDRSLVTAESGGTISLSGSSLVASESEAVLAHDNGTVNLQGADLHYTGPISVKATKCGSINAANCTVLGCFPEDSVAFYMDTEGYIDSTDAVDDAETSRNPATEQKVVKTLDANKTIYLRTDGSDSNDGKTPNTAFLTPQRAMSEMRQWVIGDYIFSVDIGEGTFNLASSLGTYSIEGANIVWSGNASEYTSLTINNIDGAPSALSTGLEYIDFDVSLPASPGAAVGQFILVKATSGGTNPNLVKGCHEIVTWNGTTNIATVRCVRVAGSTTLPSGTITADELTLVRSVFYFSGSHGITTSGARHCGNWDDLVLKGSLSYTGIWMLRGATIALGSNFGTSKWNTNLNCQYASNVQADYSVHSYSHSYTVSASTGGVMSLRYAILSGCRAVPARAFDGSVLNLQGGQVYCGGSSYSVQALRRGFVNATLANIEGCKPTSTAFYVTSAGVIDSSGAANDAATSRSQEGAPGGNGSYHVY